MDHLAAGRVIHVARHIWANLIEGRDGWTISDAVARFGPAPNGWSGRISRVAGATRSAQRLHAACIEAAGIARNASPFHAAGQAVSWTSASFATQE